MEFERKSNCIRFLTTDGISHETWLKLLTRINYLGYDIPDVDFLRDYFNRHTFLNEDQSIEVLKVFNEEQETDAFPQTEIDEYICQAKKHFGITNNINLAGYILTDGTLLKMSYDNIMRDIDHREIDEILHCETKVQSMITFINFGNIRLNNRSFEIAKPPTDKQRIILARLIRQSQLSDYQYLSVDIANTNGKVIKTLEYDFPYQTSVFHDIDDYFNSIKI